MLGDLLLLSGNDIPFLEARVIIHQPRLKEIAYLGEEKFYVGCGLLNFSKKSLNLSGNSQLDAKDDFDILMSIMISRDRQLLYSIECALSVLSLIFPLYEVGVRTDAIVLKKDEEEYYINKGNFSAFKEIIIAIFQLEINKEADDLYNPSGDMSRKIAEKLRKRHEQLNKMAQQAVSGDGKRISILSRYASILAVGLQQDLNALMQYTVCQLFDEFQRFQLKMQWDSYIQARMAGAKDLDEVDNWMIDLRDQGKKKYNRNSLKN